MPTAYWNNLDKLYFDEQLLHTVPTTGYTRPGPTGIQVELDEIEARNEEYPMTLAFLRLMDVLTDVAVPAGLGAGHRAPGFQPYLDFLRDVILLRFNTRAYKNHGEKVGQLQQPQSCALSVKRGA